MGAGLWRALFGVDDVPRLARPNYAAELPHMTLWGVVAGAAEGNMAAAVALKTFGASDFLGTIVWALPYLMNVLNVGWGLLLRGRPRKRALILVALGGIVALGSVGLHAPEPHPWSAWVFAGQIAATHLFLSGLVTLRTTMWSRNYPATHRARITGRMQRLRMLLTASTAALLALLFNKQPLAYQWAYPLAAIVGLVSLWPLRRLRIRGEAAEIARWRQEAQMRALAVGPSSHGLWNGWRSVSTGWREVGSILHDDPHFARYMVAQFLLGAANFFTDPILLNAFIKDLHFDYLSSQTLLHLLPTALLLASIRYWAALFDRVGVLRFRVVNSAVWLGSYVGATLAMLLLACGGTAWMPLALPVLVAARICNGLGHGGGAIAWDLGHLYFARAHQIELYMGIHVALTGVRGLVMPQMGMLARQAFGYSALVVAVGLALVAYVQFRRMAGQGKPSPGLRAGEG